MFTLLAHSQKGGSSRSLTVVNLAVAASHAGRRTLVVDLDPQCSAASFGDSREAEEPQIVSVTPARLTRALQAARDSGTDLAIIDTAPHSSDAAILAAEACDMILIPCRPLVFDLRSLANTARIVQLVQKPAYVLLSQCPHSPRQIEQARQAVKHFGLELAPVVIHQRAAFAHATTLGLAASEFEPDGKAAIEMRDLYAWIDSLIPKAQTNTRKPVRLHKLTRVSEHNGDVQ